ncbi:DUF2802 domain-containing protein [Chitinimonas sp. BJYL2]|uniref:DUF2802 domain-containing protein n=1 Tax=Chitinimonas sp. BJYL2 TaxID=2976696 RepID=UPI0022B31472|nr:DUF2802 domain-containing protein [Chitinimonas sp. BJYL2]
MTTIQLWLTLLSTSVLLVGVGVIYLLWQRHRVVESPPGSAATDARLDHLEDRIAALQRETASLRDAWQADAVVPDEAESAYSQAMRLAKEGLDSAEVAAGCGISRGEAELIVALYRASQRS